MWRMTHQPTGSRIPLSIPPDRETAGQSITSHPALDGASERGNGAPRLAHELPEPEPAYKLTNSLELCPFLLGAITGLHAQSDASPISV